MQLENVAKDEIPSNLFKEVLSQYENNKIYKLVVNSLKEYIEKEIDLSKINYIYGGERRDWYFSVIMAYLLKKEHITIYKDLSAVVSDSNFESSSSVSDLSEKMFYILLTF